MKEMINRVSLIGKLYQHDLKLMTVKDENSKNYGKPFIKGTIDIATDADCLNVVTVEFLYEGELTAKGKVNSNYKILSQILDGGEKIKTVIEDGMDLAKTVKINSSMGLNDFYNADGTLISARRVERGFLSFESTSEFKNEFEIDMYITSAIKNEIDPEKNIDKEFYTIKCAGFNYYKEILPFDVSLRDERGVKYFDTLDITPSTPIFSKITGKINSRTIINEVTEDGCFGEPIVKKFERKIKDWEMTNLSQNFYEFGNEGVLTEAELKTAMENRTLKLAETKKRSDEYKANKTTAVPASASASAAPATSGGFSF